MPSACAKSCARVTPGLVVAFAACLVLALAGAHYVSGGTAVAHASEVHYCEGADLPPTGECRDTVFRWITQSWGRSLNGRTVCVSAVNSNGILIEGLVCAGSTSFINHPYDGTRLLHALIENGSPEWEIFYGKINYNP